MEDSSPHPGPDPERCLSCGRRFRGEHPGCAPRATELTDETTGEVRPLPKIPGYEVERVLAVGGHGSVLLARRASDGLACAIKIARVDAASGARRLRRERLVLEAMSPPHAPRLLEVLELAGDLHLVLELIADATLATRFADLAAPMPVRERHEIARALMRAVEAMHALGFVHTDLKPENVFVRANGEVTLIDFGTARGPGIDLLGDEGPVGTVEYMAPEQLASAEPLDERSDVYALGVLLFELWVLRPPFWGTPAEVRVAVETRRPPRPSSFGAISPAVEEAILRALAKSPADRWDSVRALREALEQAFEHEPAAEQAVARPATPEVEPARKEARASRNLPLIAFVSQTDGQVVARELARLDAFITTVSGTNYVAVVDSDANETPLDHALAAARRIVTLGISRGVLVDVAPVRVKLGGQTRRYHGSALQQIATRLGDRRREGIVLTMAVAAMLQPGRTALLPLGDEARLIDHDGDLSMAEASSIAEVQPFVGRADVMTTLIRSGQAALATRRPTLVTVRGEAGIGKSRLANALNRTMTETLPTARVLAFRSQDPALAEVDDTLRAMLRRFISPSHVPLRRQEIRERLQPQVGDAWPAVALTLGWFGHDAPELVPLAQAPGALRVTAIEATGRLIRRAAEHTPLCIILDDAQLADATTLDALELATLDRGGDEVPLWICVLVRPSFDALRPTWGERAKCSEAVDLPPLSSEAAAELCRLLLEPAENLPAQAIEMITARAHGNPMLFGELCRALKTEGIIRQERTGAWILETDRVDAWPQTTRLQWLAERELGRLPPDLASHAQLAALLGPKFAVGDMIGVMKVLETSPVSRHFPLDPKVALAHLDEAQILRIRARHSCEFRNATLCEAMRATIPEALRIELHRAAFEHYRDLHHMPEERRRPRIAFHAAEAGLRGPAAMAYEALASEYLYRHHYVEAEGSFSRMLALVDGVQQRQAAHHGRGLARYRTGRYEDALGDLRQAHALATELGDQRAELELLLDEATVQDWLQNYRRSAELVEQAAARATADPEPAIAARVAMGRARSLWRLGKRVEARASTLEAIGRAEAAGAAAYESLVVALLMRGTVLSYLGEIREAREVFERILTLARAQGDRFHEIAALNNRRLVWIAEKDIASAAADLRSLLDIGRSLGLVLVELVGTYNLGELLYNAGDAAAARPHVQRAVVLAARRADLMPRPLARLLELRLLALEGRWHDVRTIGGEVAGLHRSAHEQGRSDAQFLPAEELLLDAILLASTGGSVEAWAEVRERASRVAEEQQRIELIELEAVGALRAGDRTRARRLLDEALEIAGRVPTIVEARLRLRLAAIDAEAA